jgi:outer membrane receptor protein involved in Fe transport
MTRRSHRPAPTSTPRAARPLALRPWWAPTVLAAAIGSAYGQVAPAPAAAASAPAPASLTGTATGTATEAATSLETVTISATRRRELIRDVPLSISGVSAERLQETGAKSLNDYLATQPGVLLQNSGAQDGNGYIIFRGLTLGSDTNQPTTVYVDDVPLVPGTPFDMSLLDMARFEVLRGPQGTLYGASAMGGVVKYITQEGDTGEFAGRVGLGLSQTRHGGANWLGNAVLNVPLKTDVAALRVAAFDSKDDGWVNATGPVGKDKVNSRDAHGGRISLLVTPNRDLSVKLSATTQTRNADGNSRILYDYATRQPAAGDLVFTQLTLAEPRKSQRDLYSVTVDYDLQWARFTSLTSTQKAKETSITDFSTLGAAVGLDSAYVGIDLDNKQTTQEFRLVSQQAGMLEWLGGLYFNKFEYGGSQATIGRSGGADIDLGSVPIRRVYNEKAAYGTVTFNASPQLALTGGLRLARYDQTDGTSPGDISFQETPKTYLLTARYRLTPQSSVYARAASGYRPGGSNFGNTTGPRSYGTDSVWTYEAGYKAAFPEAGATVEVALFDTEWKDLQLFTPGADALSFGYTTNSGKARVRGLEAAATLKPISALSFSAALSLLDAKLLSDAPGLQALSGDRLPTSPKVAGSLNARYAFALAGLPSFVALGATHQGQRNTGFERATTPLNYSLPAYTQFDLSAGASVGRVDISAYVRNLTDKRGQIGASTQETLSTGRTYVRVIDPRTVGVNLTASF